MKKVNAVLTSTILPVLLCTFEVIRKSVRVQSQVSCASLGRDELDVNVC